MARSRQYYVYLMTNRRGTLYTGVTNDLQRRAEQHRCGESVFTSRYRIGKLVYYETTQDVRAAIEREKQIKGWTRAKKVALVTAVNPAWKDLSKELFSEWRCHSERSEESVPGSLRPYRQSGPGLSLAVLSG